MTKAKKLEWQIEGEVDVRPKMQDVWESVRKGIQAGPVVVTLSRPTRSSVQNRLMWAMLRDVSKQVEWFGEWLTDDDWKNMLTAGVVKQRAVPGVDGGAVMIGQSTSAMNKPQFSELIDFIRYFGDSKQVQWSDFAASEYDNYKEAG